MQCILHAIVSAVSTSLFLLQTKQRHNRLNNLLASMVSEMSPRTRCFNSRAGLVQDVLPYLLQVAVPSLRPVRRTEYCPRITVPASDRYVGPNTALGSLSQPQTGMGGWTTRLEDRLLTQNRETCH